MIGQLIRLNLRVNKSNWKVRSQIPYKQSNVKEIGSCYSVGQMTVDSRSVDMPTMTKNVDSRTLANR